jgi:hypothetical protein
VTQPTDLLPASAVQRAIVALLRADTTLKGMLAAIKGVSPATAAVIDDIPEGQAYPYVAVGDHLSIPDNDLTSFGRQVTETLHVWTQTRSMAPGQAIADRIALLLDHQDRALTVLLSPLGHRCVRISLEFDQALRDPDPKFRHHVLRFRIITAQEEA